MATATVVGVAIYRQDAVVLREGVPLPCPEETRGDVMEFSYASRQRLAFVASNTEADFTAMVTLTYPRLYPEDGHTVKAQLNTFLTWLRRTIPGISYLWFLEFQKRGAPHIHLLMDFWPRTRPAILGLRVLVASAWWRAVGSYNGDHWLAGTRAERLRSKDGGRHYAVKYSMKMRQKAVPELYRNVGRFWGASRDVMPEPLQERRATEDDIRARLEGWEHYAGEDKPLYTVLYNQGGRFSTASDTTD